MRKVLIWVATGYLAFVGAIAVAQGGRKPGLWEVTTKITWQQSPFPGGTAGGPGSAGPMTAAPHTAQLCLTQEMIDKYGGPIPQSHNNECQISNINKTATSMTADWICNGHMSGKGSIRSSWTDDDHTTARIHFTGTITMGQGGSRPVEWTSESNSVYKGPECGAVRPVEQGNQGK